MSLDLTDAENMLCDRFGFNWDRGQIGWRTRHLPWDSSYYPEVPYRCGCIHLDLPQCVQGMTQEDFLCNECRQFCTVNLRKTRRKAMPD